MTSLSPELEAFRDRVVAFMDPHVAEYGQAARLGLSLDDDIALARRWQ
jgi:hypothetical protein